MEVINLIKTGDMLPSIYDICFLGIIVSIFCLCILYACFLAVLDGSYNIKWNKISILKCIIISTFISVAISLICLITNPKSSTYYGEKN